jgi:hypothetical protein
MFISTFPADKLEECQDALDGFAEVSRVLSFSRRVIPRRTLAGFQNSSTSNIISAVDLHLSASRQFCIVCKTILDHGLEQYFADSLSEVSASLTKNYAQLLFMNEALRL